MSELCLVFISPPQPSPVRAIWFVSTRTISRFTGDIARGRASRSSRFRCAIPPIEQGIERSRVLVCGFAAAAPYNSWGRDRGMQAKEKSTGSVGVIDRLSVLCFAGTYGLALLAELARFVVRGAVRWYLAAALMALGWLVQTAFLANVALRTRRCWSPRCLNRSCCCRGSWP